MDRLPESAARTRARVRAFELAMVYPEGAAVGPDDHFYTQTLAILLEAAELARELREEKTGRLYIGSPRRAAGQAIERHGTEEEVSGVLLLDDLNCFLAEEIFAPCLPRAYHKKGRLSVEAATATVLQAAERHGATGAILFHLLQQGHLPWGDSDELIVCLRREGEPHGFRLLDYLLITPPHFESLQRFPSWKE
jgi:hypothetical protein